MPSCWWFKIIWGAKSSLSSIISISGSDIKGCSTSDVEEVGRGPADTNGGRSGPADTDGGRSSPADVDWLSTSSVDVDGAGICWSELLLADLKRAAKLLALAMAAWAAAILGSTWIFLDLWISLTSSKSSSSKSYSSGWFIIYLRAM